jgi:hypothetical protein
VKCEAGDDFTVANLHFDQDDTYINQDGVHVCGPANRITIRDLTGGTWDDAAVLNVGGAVDAYGPVHGGGPIEHAVVQDVRVAGHRCCRLFTERGRALRDVEIAGVATWGPVTHNAVELNATYADAVPNPGNVRAEGCDQAVNVDSPATDLRIDGVTARNVNDTAVRFQRPVGNVSVRGVEHRSDPAAVDSDEARKEWSGPLGTATLRWTEAATAGEVLVRDVVARETGPGEKRLNTAIVVTESDTELNLTFDEIEVRGAKRAFAPDHLATTIRDLHTTDVTE